MLSAPTIELVRGVAATGGLVRVRLARAGYLLWAEVPEQLLAASM
ncbi:hypothetical protein [Frondihabitans sp. PAMC 28766]|nr:hypothetical protein [Frondihabitans sp. PAMC 28766]